MFCFPIQKVSITHLYRLVLNHGRRMVIRWSYVWGVSFYVQVRCVNRRCGRGGEEGGKVRRPSLFFWVFPFFRKVLGGLLDVLLVCCCLPFFFFGRGGMGGGEELLFFFGGVFLGFCWLLSFFGGVICLGVPFGCFVTSGGNSRSFQETKLHQ